MKGFQGRRKRIDWIIKQLESAEGKAGGEPLDSVKFVALCAYNLGVSTRKTIEYLSMLAGLGMIRIDWDEGKIHFEKDL